MAAPRQKNKPISRIRSSPCFAASIQRSLISLFQKETIDLLKHLF
jgi:hypothetical protein